jgi:nucleotide-binding universal stress UspA family protein
MSASIVCGVDGSPESQDALRVAARLADSLDLRLIVANIAEPVYIPYAAAAPLGGMAGQEALLSETESQQDVAEAVVDEVVAAAGVRNVGRRAAVGVPAERLADIADEEKAELIVVGSRGRGAFKAAFLGSVSHSLLGVARCPVLIVPPGVTDAS